MTMDKTGKSLETVIDKNGNQTRRWKGTKKADDSANADKLKGVSPSFNKPPARDPEKAERVRKKSNDNAKREQKDHESFMKSIGDDRRNRAVSLALSRHGGELKRMPPSKRRAAIRKEAEKLPPRPSAEVSKYNPGIRELYRAMEFSGDWKADKTSRTPVFRAQSFEHPEVGRVTPTIRTKFGYDEERLTTEDYNSYSNGDSRTPRQKLPNMRNYLTLEDEDGQPLNISGTPEQMSDFSYEVSEMGWHGWTSKRSETYSQLDCIESGHIETLPEDAETVAKEIGWFEDALAELNVSRREPGSFDSFNPKD